MSYRRILTGIDALGRSCVVSDDRISETGMGDSILWLRGPDGIGSVGSEPVPFFAAPGQSIFKIVHLPATDALPSSKLREASDRFFQAIGDPWCRKDLTRSPFMHRTPTTDYVTVLSGTVSLILDSGEPVTLRPFDSVVQRQTNHAWRVHGTEQAILLCVMVGDPDRVG